MHSIKEMILYREFENGRLLDRFAGLMGKADGFTTKEDKKNAYYACLHDFMELAATYGFEGNLWHSYLTLLLVSHENAFSRACEIGGEAKGSICAAARHDFAIFKELFDFDLSKLENALGVAGMDLIARFKGTDGGSLFNRRIRDRICALSVCLGKTACAEEFQNAVTDFYREFGVGKLGLHKAFRIERGKMGAEIVPIANIAHVSLDDLVGYEIAKKKLTDNTEAFVEGRKANNCLLYGDAGTGKSTCVKAIANLYYGRGLRLIELYKHQFQDLHDVIAQVKNRNYKFIIYMDDLSFEDFEVEYKYLKAVIEGGLEKKPDNILIYATSNRRHLIREKFSDKAELSDDLHNNDTVQEKLSLSARFGVQIYFGAPDKKEFGQIVTTLARVSRIQMGEEELLQEANKWELSHGGRSGRTAQQFIDYLLGKGGNL